MVLLLAIVIQMYPQCDPTQRAFGNSGIDLMLLHHRASHTTNELWPETANTLKRVIGHASTCFNTFIALGIEFIR